MKDSFPFTSPPLNYVEVQRKTAPPVLRLCLITSKCNERHFVSYLDEPLTLIVVVVVIGLIYD